MVVTPPSDAGRCGFVVAPKRWQPFWLAKVARVPDLAGEAVDQLLAP